MILYVVINGSTMEKKKRRITKSITHKDRKVISFKEALKDIIPVEWERKKIKKLGKTL